MAKTFAGFHIQILDCLAMNGEKYSKILLTFKLMIIEGVSGLDSNLTIPFHFAS